MVEYINVLVITNRYVILVDLMEGFVLYKGIFHMIINRKSGEH